MKVYDEGDDNIRDFILNNQTMYAYSDGKLTITSKFTEADANILTSLLNELDELKFDNTEFEGESFSILCESLKKSERVS